MASRRPRLLIVTGAPGTGKSTLARSLASALRVPWLSRDGLKEGYLATLGRGHAEAGSESNAIVTDLFFESMLLWLDQGVSFVAEAAFQAPLWRARLSALKVPHEPAMIVCEADPREVAERLLRRRCEDPSHAYFHGTGAESKEDAGALIARTRAYQTPDLAMPTLLLSTDQAIEQSLAEALRWVHALGEDEGEMNGDIPDNRCHD